MGIKCVLIQWKCYFQYLIMSRTFLETTEDIFLLLYVCSRQTLIKLVNYMFRLLPADWKMWYSGNTLIRCRKNSILGHLGPLNCQSICFLPKTSPRYLRLWVVEVIENLWEMLLWWYDTGAKCDLFYFLHFGSAPIEKHLIPLLTYI